MLWRFGKPGRSVVNDFFEELDRLWAPASEPRIRLKVFGSVALFLQTDFERTTKDADVLATSDLPTDVLGRLVLLAGRRSALSQKTGMFLDMVSPSVPMMPADPLWHDDFSHRLQNFDIQCLDVADVLVSKLKRFSKRDQDDVQEMIVGGHVEHERMLSRFLSVIERYRFSARAADLEEMAVRFNQVERDMFLVDETHFDLVDLKY